jgi:UDP-N-acetyl-D-mannosaminuronic acid dehydrogenase
MVLKKGNLIILESTVPVGTTEKMAQLLSELRPDLKFPIKFQDHADINIAFCPERILPGNIIEEIVNNDRVVGGISKTCTQRAVDLYRIFVKGVIFETNARTAELSKLIENSYRDVNIAFANHVANICRNNDIDVHELIKYANRHPRVNILNPGIGVGGHCLAVDPWFLVTDHNNNMDLIKVARQLNDSIPRQFVQNIIQVCSKFDNPTITCLGLSYKPDVSDYRNSPAMEVVKLLIESKVGTIIVSDPLIDQIPYDDHVDISSAIFIKDYKIAIDKSNIIILLVPHKTFGLIQYTEFDNKILIDFFKFFK